MIFSRRHKVDVPVIWVEKLNGKDQSYMTGETYHYFRNQRWLDVIPVTTRRKEQYGRLQEALQELGWNKALICNGALLFMDGHEDERWTEESLQITAGDRPELQRLRADAEMYCTLESIVDVDPFFFYIKSDNPDEIYQILKKNADSSHISVLKSSRRVYCIPNSLSKGHALERYKNHFQPEAVYAAGDSNFDTSMLCRAEVCFCPEYMAPFLMQGKRITCSGIFSDSICAELKKMRVEDANSDR